MKHIAIAQDGYDFQVLVTKVFDNLPTEEEMEEFCEDNAQNSPTQFVVFNEKQLKEFQHQLRI